MPKGFYKEVSKLLIKAGYRHSGNAKGSHEWWIAANGERKVIVPRNLNSRHTANSILRDAKIGKKL